jgi:hypothetical protein
LIRENTLKMVIVFTDCPAVMLMAGEKMTDKKFSFSVFLIKLTSRAFWVWLITTAMVGYVLYTILNNPKTPTYTWTAILLGIWGGTALLFVGGNVLIDALGKMIEKANLTINNSINATANTSISGAAGGNATATAADQNSKK